jgi:hypothetical protein
VDDLGGHERRRSDDHAAVARRNHCTEVDQLGRAGQRTTHIARADIAVNQTPRMDQGERGTDVEEQRASFTPGHRRPFAQVLPFEQLHRVVRPVGIQAVVVDFDDSRVCELGEGVELALEQRCGFAAALVVGRARELLQRNLAPSRTVGGAVHRRHAAAAEPFGHVVAVADSRGRIACASSRLGSHLSYREYRVFALDVRLEG